MEKKWTPGPWRAFYKNKYDEWHVSIPLENSNMRWAIFPDGINSRNPAADAHLVAAAPELYDALENLLACVVKSRGYNANEAVINAVKALAKARGEDAKQETP